MEWGPSNFMTAAVLRSKRFVLSITASVLCAPGFCFTASAQYSFLMGKLRSSSALPCKPAAGMQPILPMMVSYDGDLLHMHEMIQWQCQGRHGHEVLFYFICCPSRK